MIKYNSLFLLAFLTLIFSATTAQENIQSTKILYNQGLEEVYDVKAYNQGYIALGHKGDEATTKKLWLIKFDEKLNVIGSKVIYNQELVSPFRLQPLANGNVLVLAQDASQELQSAVLFCLQPDGTILWSKRFADKVNVELSDLLVSNDQTIYLYGAKKHIINTLPNTDQALLIKLDKQANQLWQKEIEMGAVELRTKQLYVDKQQRIILTGTTTDIDANATYASSKSAPIIVDAPQKALRIVNAPDAKSWERINPATVFMNDTTYVEDPITGNINMIITPHEPTPELLKKLELLEKINSDVEKSYSAVLVKDPRNKEAKIIIEKKETISDTSYVEDPITGEINLIISDRKQLAKANANMLQQDKVKRDKSNSAINFYALQLNLNGELLNSTSVNQFADYSFSNAVVETDNGYLFLVQSANYFGEGILLQTDQNLNWTKQLAAEGTPILHSGLFKHNEQYIIGGVFSNTLNDYSPGFVMLDKNLGVLQAKSSKSLFTNFFVTNIASLKDNSFMLSGIGYEHNQASDVYFLPFTTSGNSVCEMTDYKIAMKKVADVSHHKMTTSVMPTNTVRALNVQIALADENNFKHGNICTTPDEHPVSETENGSWNQWSNKNADAFSIKIPTDWIEISPNPNNGAFTVQYNGMQNEVGLKATVTDINGRIVHAEFIQNQDSFKLDLRQYPSGVYNIRIDDGVKSLTKKVEFVK